MDNASILSKPEIQGPKSYYNYEKEKLEAS